MAPNNKYGIWTEDQITLFTQIVSGRHFNCMPYHVSTKPDLPSVVGLFFNIPEQVIKDGNIVMQPGPKQISIHEYLIEKVGQEMVKCSPLLCQFPYGSIFSILELLDEMI